MVARYGDLIFRGYILRALLESDRDLTIVVDSQPTELESSGAPDYAWCSAVDDRSLWGQDVLLEQLSDEPERAGEPAHGRWIGMLGTRGQGRQWLETAMDELEPASTGSALSMRDLLNHIVASGHPVRVIYIHGHWLDVNSISDLERAGTVTTGSE